MGKAKAAKKTTKKASQPRIKNSDCGPICPDCDNHMRLGDLTEAERLVIEKMRILKDGEGFDYLPRVIAECLDILKERKARYNKVRGVTSVTFRRGDVSMLEAFDRPVTRLESVVSDGNGGFQQWVPDSRMKDIIHDAANYALIWICNRYQRADNGA